MSEYDLIVLGAGPAGANAALAAAGCGLRVALIDEQLEAGGQVWRAPSPGLSGLPTSHERRAGDDLRRTLGRSTVWLHRGCRVWSVTTGFQVDMVGPEGAEAVHAPLLVAATGAHERVVPFPGWTLPGVIGLAAATILLKAHAVLPGRATVVAGVGPLLAAVAAGIVKGGGHVVAVADLAGPGDWLAAGPALLREPGLLARGAGWALLLAGARIPVLFRHGVRRAEGADALDRVVLAPVDGAGAWTEGRERAFDADCLAVGHGLVPGAEVPRLLRAAMRFDRRRGGWVPALDADGRTSVPGLYAAGDGAGIGGAALAAAAGTRAGLAAARDAGHVVAARSGGATSAVAAAMAGLMALRPAQVAAIPPETIVCRCEDVSRADIGRAAQDGAADVNQLKHFTRCGMGPCQGRFCGDVAAELLAQHRGVPRETVGLWTARVPLRPVPLADLLGQFRYADIPVPPPAPL